MDNINITVNETIENVVVNPSITTETIDVNLYATTETVDISITPNLTTVNINTVTGGGLVTSVNGQVGDIVLNIPANTSDLINDGEDGINPFITLNDIPVSGLTSVGLTMPVAFNVANSPLTSDGTIAVSAAGTSSQYIRGDGQLATLPTGAGGGSTVAYYLNGSINASVAGYKQLSNTATIGGGTDFTLAGNGLIAQFLTDLGNPNRLEIPGGAWNFEMYFQASSAGGNQKFYVELLKYNGTTFTSIASTILVPEEITGGTAIDLYLTSLAVPTTTLLVTDRLVIRVYIVDNSGGRTITLHTEDNTLCEIITTFSGGVTSLNGLTANTQYLAVGTSGTDFNISSLTDTHTFNLPTASATNRGALNSADWTIFNEKFTLPTLTSGSVLFSNGTTITQKNSNFFWDDTNNRLGIGTNVPTNVLDVRGTAVGTEVLFKLTNNGSTSFVGAYDVLCPNASNGSSFYYRFGKANTANNNSSATYYHTSDGSSLNRLSFNIGTSNVSLLAGGNVGIGTTSPTAKLHIAAPGALSTDIALRVRNSADTLDIIKIDGALQTTFNVGASNPIILGKNVTYPTVPSISMNNTLSDTLMAGFFADDLNFYINSPNRIIIRGSGNANNSSFVFSNGAMGQGYGAYATNPSTSNGIFILDKLGVGTNAPVASAKVQIDSTTQGFLPPRMTTTQKNAIATPASGLVVYDTTLGKLCVRGASAWETITSI